MGYFSKMFADKANEQALHIGRKAYLLCPDGTTLCEPSYDGYGRFDGHDMYDLVADWNRPYLAEHPDHVLPHHNKRVGDLPWYGFYVDPKMSKDEILSNIRKLEGCGCFEWRWIGIELACYDEDNASLPYPIKVASKAGYTYAELPPSNNDPDQGCGPITRKRRKR